MIKLIKGHLEKPLIFYLNVVFQVLMPCMGTTLYSKSMFPKKFFNNNNMEWIPVFLGVLIALAFYLHFITKLNEKDDKLKQADIEIEEKEEKKETENDISQKKLKQRICPLCGTFLDKHENLYAEMYKGKERPKVIIHGCRYCYTPRKKKTNLQIEKEDLLENKQEGI